MPRAAKRKRTRAARANKSLRQLPSVDELLRQPRLQELSRECGREMVVTEARAILQERRKEIPRPAASSKTPPGEPSTVEIETAVIERVRRVLAPSLRRVINATGVILHTNLGRAPLSMVAVDRIREIAGRYSNLEYDLASGKRGRRDAHTSDRLARVAGAEAAIVVNNNAAAVLIVLSALAKGGEVVVSRGELIEIGDGFRIPEIMAESGAQLREVGTTNRTRIRDYENAINKRTRLLLRVHPSNFRIVGFTERPSLRELAQLGRKRDLPVFEDLGSGCLTDLRATGIAEPLVTDSIKAGAAIVAFSGDKLLGGPQAGIIAGRRKLIDRIRRHPLFRAVRVDKLTTAALEATLAAYLRGATREIPVQNMLSATAEELRVRGESFLERLRPHLPAGASAKLVEGFSVLGGGATPEQKLPTHLIAINSPQNSAALIQERLRRHSGIPIIARIEGARLLLDLRTVFADEEGVLACALVGALR
jgi:L-seryl-tRNA(Ser) seleniumtransferase